MWETLFRGSSCFSWPLKTNPRYSPCETREYRLSTPEPRACSKCDPLFDIKRLRQKLLPQNSKSNPNSAPPPLAASQSHHPETAEANPNSAGKIENEEAPLARTVRARNALSTRGLRAEPPRIMTPVWARIVRTESNQLQDATAAWFTCATRAADHVQSPCRRLPSR